jgi:hypothetical protein
MLSAFYRYLAANTDKTYLHWNMRDISFGFAALEHRFRVLHALQIVNMDENAAPREPVVIDDNRKVDLSRLLIAIYGITYIPHRRLDNLMEKNNIEKKDFMTGADEAEAFEKGDYVALHQSTLRKVDILAAIAERAHGKTLKTNATFWERNGGYLPALFVWVLDNPVIVGFSFVWTLLSGLGIIFYIIKKLLDM